VIDRRNYHLFRPLRYQIATAALSPADIAAPIRSTLSRQKNATVLLGRVVAVDKAAQRIGWSSLYFGPIIRSREARGADCAREEIFKELLEEASRNLK
jgi:NADH dehydrogenase FAD-containing subunit